MPHSPSAGLAAPQRGPLLAPRLTKASSPRWFFIETRATVVTLLSIRYQRSGAVLPLVVITGGAEYGTMNARSSRYAAPGPNARGAAAFIASVFRSPLDGYVRLSARYGDTIRVPYRPGNSLYLLTRPEHAEHVLAANQDNYVKAFTYRPLRALIGDGLLTSEGERWRRHRRLVQPVFSRRHVTTFGPAMSEAAQRLAARWESLAEGTAINVAGQMSAVALDIVGQALLGCGLSRDAELLGRAPGEMEGRRESGGGVGHGGLLGARRCAGLGGFEVGARALRRRASGWDQAPEAGVEGAADRFRGGRRLGRPPYLVHRDPGFWA